MALWGLRIRGSAENLSDAGAIGEFLFGCDSAETDEFLPGDAAGSPQRSRSGSQGAASRGGRKTTARPSFGCGGRRRVSEDIAEVVKPHGRTLRQRHHQFQFAADRFDIARQGREVHVGLLLDLGYGWLLDL